MCNSARFIYDTRIYNYMTVYIYQQTVVDFDLEYAASMYE